MTLWVFHDVIGINTILACLACIMPAIPALAHFHVNNFGYVVLLFVSCCAQSKFPEISYADLYTLAGVVAVEEAG